MSIHAHTTALSDDEPRPVATGLIAAAPDYGPDAVVIFLDSPPAGRRFRAGERVTIRSGGQP